MIVSRYLTREVFNATFAITIVLLLAFLSQQIVRYLNYVAIGKIPTSIFLQLVSFEIPYLLALLLPLALYLGILLAYGRLYTDNEMAILQLCGFGNRQLMGLTSLFTLFVTSVVLFLMLWVNPWISAKRQIIMKSDEATLHMIQTLIPGRFQASPDGRHVIYVEKLSRDHQQAKSVFLAQKANKTDEANQPWTIVYANEGYQVKDKMTTDQFFVTQDGYRYEGTPGQNDYRITQFKKYQIRIPQVEVHVIHQEDETLPSAVLWHDYHQPKRAAELQWRVSIGFSALLLAILAIPFSAVEPRKNRYLIIFPAILVYIIYFNLLFIARHWVDEGRVPVYIGMWWVHVLILFFILIVYFIASKRIRVRF